MESAAVLLVLVSAVLHPLRDLTLKGVPDALSAYAGVSLFWIGLAACHAWLGGLAFAVPPGAWIFVIMSALGLAVYYYGTLAALRRGHLSVYYPIIRSSPLMIVAISWLFLGRSYSWVTLSGIGMILVAGLAIQKSDGRLLDDPKAFMLASAAMAGSAVYSIADASAMQVMPPAVFLFYVYILSSVLLVLMHAFERREAGYEVFALVRGWFEAPWRIVFAAVSSYVSYYMILVAFQLGTDAAAVISVRQASIPVSVVMATIILKETRFLRRMGWALLLAVGIVLVATG